MTFKFLWNGPDKATRALSYKKLIDGGLNIPNYKARAEAIQAGWISAMQTKETLHQVFDYPNVDWSNPLSFDTPFPYLLWGR